MYGKFIVALVAAAASLPSPLGAQTVKVGLINSYTVLVTVGSTALVARFVGAGRSGDAVHVANQTGANRVISPAGRAIRMQGAQRETAQAVR